MNILFLHQNFPGQFLHLAPALQARGHRVMALTVEGNQRKSTVPVVHYRRPDPPAAKGIGKTYDEMAERGAAVARACAQLGAQQDFVPDVIFAHCGWGEALFLREVFPAARILVYAEFHYRGTGLDSDFDPEFAANTLGARIGVMARTAHIAQSLLHADAGLAPTEWQRGTFPEALRQKIRVIHDGIATETMVPDPAARVTLASGRVLSAGDEVLTFVNRNLEPYRGYHVFMRALPAILARRPEAQVVIVGGEGTSYGRQPPEGQSWKRIFLNEVAGRIDADRVHFPGQVPYPAFRALMQLTRVHAYLTYPFVLSWSMLEAMSAGALVIGSRTGPVTEVIEDGVNGRLVDFFDVDGWADAICHALADPQRDQPLRRAARQTVIDRFDLRGRCLPDQIRWIEAGR